MKRSTRSTLMAALTLVAVSAGAARAADGEAVMRLGEIVAPPAGFIALCEASPTDCTGSAGSAEGLEAVRTWAGRTRWSLVFDAAGLTLPPAPDLQSPAPAATSKASPGDRARIRAAKDAARKAAQRPTKTALKAEPATAAAEPVARPAPAPPPASTPLPDRRALQFLNARINRAIRSSTDLETFGLPDVWTAPSGPRPRGDCEDYVLAKRRALIEAGVDPVHLSIALVRTRSGEAHAVLLVATDDGEQVLDNLSPWVMRWDAAPYEWTERQAPGEPLRWVRPASGR